MKLLERWMTGLWSARLTSEQKKDDAKLAEEREKLKWQKDHMYDELHTDDQMAEASNQDRDADFLDDFM